MIFNIQQFIDHDETAEFFKWDFEHWKYIDDKKQ